MARRRKRINPLLYIDQQSYQEVTTSMQDKFIFNDREQVEEKEYQEPEEVVGESSVAVDQEEADEAVEEKEKKSFKEMPIEEKIDYLEQFPASIVKIQYSFITKENKFVGYFLSKEDEYIRVFPRNKRKPVSILINEIQDIKISGL